MSRIGPEARLEDECRRRFRKAGGRLIKVEGERGDLDRLAIQAPRVIFFVEFKRFGEKPTKLQEFRIRKHREMGFVAGYADSVDRFMMLWFEAKRQAEAMRQADPS